MRLTTWNCRQGIDTKRAAIDELACDVLIIPECSRTPALANELGVSFAWRGDLPSKGLGVFGFNGWTIPELPDPEPHPWCLPVEARSPTGAHRLTVLAVWTVKRPGDGRPSYAKQFAEVLERWGAQIASGHVIIAGDLNASFQGPSSAAHGRNIDTLHGLGACSAYHRHRGLAHGDLEPATLRWAGRGGNRFTYHCDYVFVSERLAPKISSAEIGPNEIWVDSSRSDHCPVSVELDLDRS